MNVLALYSAFSDTILAERLGLLVKASQGWKSRLPTGRGRSGTTDLLSCLAGQERLPPKRFLSCWAAPLTGESRHLLGHLLSTFTGTAKLPASSATSLGYVRQKNKMQATHHHTVPWIPRSLVSLPSSLHLSGPFCVWFIYGTGFSVVLSGRNRERYIYLFHVPICGSLYRSFKYR